jgi:hypothetical protein
MFYHRYAIMLRCWNAEGSERPRFQELKQLIEETKSTLGQSQTRNNSTTTTNYSTSLPDLELSDSESGYNVGEEE